VVSEKRRKMATLNEFCDYSEVMANETSQFEEVEAAKSSIMEIMSEFTEDQHMHMCIDMIASLAYRDLMKFAAVMMAAHETVL
jgi:hypothetical protein